MALREELSLEDFLRDVITLLALVASCREVLFRRDIREPVLAAIEDATRRIAEFNGQELPEFSDEMRFAGLSGAQLQLKLRSFQASNADFKEHGRIDLLAEVLGKGKIILSSLGGAIPVFGSFAQELIDFLLRELGGRWKFWKRK